MSIKCLLEMVVRGEFVGQVIASEDEFTCNECGKRFKKKKQLTDHKRNHKRTCCPWCGKEGSKNHLKRHMKTCDKKPMEVEVTGEQCAVAEAVVVAPDSLSSGDQEPRVETATSCTGDQETMDQDTVPSSSPDSLCSGDQGSRVDVDTAPSFSSGGQETMDQETAPASSPANLCSGDQGSRVETVPSCSGDQGHRVGDGIGLDQDMALKLIFHALEEEKQTSMFQAGVEALQQITAQLPHHPLFCEAILLIPYINFYLPPELLDQLAAAASPPQPEDSSTGQPDQPGPRQDPSTSTTTATTTTTGTTSNTRKFYNKHSSNHQGVVKLTNLHSTTCNPDGTPKRVRYTKEDLHLSTILLYLSHKMYKYIRAEGLLHLPHPNLIRRHISHYQFRPGHQDEQFYLLEQKMQGMQDPRNCQVDMIFDEVHLEVFTTAGHILACLLRTFEAKLSDIHEFL